MLFASKAKFVPLPLEKSKHFFFSIKGFGVSMATFSIDPSRVGINMSSSGQATIPPEVANNAFICAYAFEHIATPTHALPLCQ